MNVWHRVIHVYGPTFHGVAHISPETLKVCRVEGPIGYMMGWTEAFVTDLALRKNWNTRPDTINAPIEIVA